MTKEGKPNYCQGISSLKAQARNTVDWCAKSNVSICHDGGTTVLQCTDESDLPSICTKQAMRSVESSSFQLEPFKQNFIKSISIRLLKIADPVTQLLLRWQWFHGTVVLVRLEQYRSLYNFTFVAKTAAEVGNLLEPLPQWPLSTI